MTLVKRIIDNHMTQFIDLSIAEVLLLGQFQNFLSIGSSQEFALAIQ